MNGRPYAELSKELMADLGDVDPDTKRRVTASVEATAHLVAYMESVDPIDDNPNQ